MAFTVENLDRYYRKRSICILSNSQAAIKALENYQINPELVWDCHQPLMKLAKHHRVQLMWEVGYEGIEGNKTANQLARLGSKCLVIGPEPVTGISAGIAKKAVGDWTNRDHKKYWQSLTGLKQARDSYEDPLSERPSNC
jgi:hypothetical protein